MFSLVVTSFCCTIALVQTLLIPSIAVVRSGRLIVYETGVLEYTALENCTRIRIRCSVPESTVRANLSLHRAGYEDLLSNMNGERVTTDFSNCNNSEALYTCRVRFSNVTENGLYNYEMDTHFRLKPVFGSTICAANVGTVVVEGEKYTLFCAGGGNYWQHNLKDQTTKVGLPDVSQSPLSCGHNTSATNGTWIEECVSPNITVLPSTGMNITPETFDHDSPFLEFICLCYPPRLMYWVVYTDRGDIMDQENLKESLKVETNITIEQAAGNTTIRIAEAVPGGNGIHTVICYTYETRLKHAVARLVSMTSYDEGGRTSECDIETDHGDEQHEMTTKDKGTQTGSNIPYVVVIGVLCLMLFSIGLLAFFKHLTLKKDSTKTDEDDVIPPGTILHMNSIYQSANGD